MRNKDRYESFFNAFDSNKDDLYNLSVRKKVAQLCVKLITDIGKLDLCYEEIEDENENIKIYRQNNRQIKIICENILKTVNTKTKIPSVQTETEKKREVRLYICVLLTEISEGIITLSNLISIRHIERELVYASEIILKQLIDILPYKLDG